MLFAQARAGFRSLPQLSSGVLRFSHDASHHAESCKGIAQERDERESIGAAGTDDLSIQLELDSQADLLRRIFFGPGGLQRSRTINQRLQSNQQLSADHDESMHGQSPFFRLRVWDGETQAALTASMDLLRFQLKACTRPDDFSRVFAVAFRSRHLAQVLNDRNLQRLVCIKLERHEDLQGVLAALNVLVHRLQSYRLPIESGIVWLALKTSARCHALTSTRRYLRLWGRRMTSHQLVGVLFALKEGLGKTGVASLHSNQRSVLEILYGSPDARGHDRRTSGQYSLRYYMRGHTAESMTLWLSILAQCGAKDVMWDELLLFWNDTAKCRESTANSNGLVTTKPEPRKEEVLLVSKHAELSDSSSIEWKPPLYEERMPSVYRDCDEAPGLLMTSVTRTALLEFIRIGDPGHAWQVYSRVSGVIDNKDDEVWDALFSIADHMPSLEPAVQQHAVGPFIKRLIRSLRHIENQMGIKWVVSKKGHDHHQLLEEGAFRSSINHHAHDKSERPRGRVTLVPGNMHQTTRSMSAEISSEPENDDLFEGDD